MDLEKIYFIYRLLQLKGVGNVLANKVLERLSSKAENLTFDSTDNVIKDELGNILTESQIEEFTKINHKLLEQLNKLTNKDVSFISVLNPAYPKILKNSFGKSSPPVLSCMGNLELLEMTSVGFCGSRKASERGLEVARDCTEQLSKQNVALVSGYAAGIDQQVHLTALESSGYTIIVLPEGIMNFKFKKLLQSHWDWDRVLVISEFIPDDIWLASRAMQRNSTIVALSNVMILIEAARNGGSIDAGKKALKLNRTLYVPRYENMGESAEGNKELLDLGAIPLLRDKNTGRANLNHLFDNISHFKSTKNHTVKQLTFL